MPYRFGRYVLALDDADIPGRDLIGNKAWSIAHMRSLGLDVPPAFVVTTDACREYLQTGALPECLDAEVGDALAWLEAQTGRRFGGGASPLLVSVRSGAPVSMPGMMDTILDVGACAEVEAALHAESGDAAFARDTHRRFLEMYARTVLGIELDELPADETAEQWRERLERLCGERLPEGPRAFLDGAIRAVFASWNGRRARRYRDHQGIAHTLGTAVTVQSMIFGNLDDRSGTGVMFSRNPLTGDATPYGEYLPRAQGEDVVSGRHSPRPLATLAEALPDAHAKLLAAASQLERAANDIQDIEFTVQRGQLFLLQTRVAKRSPEAALRIAVDLVDEGRITPAEALRRVSAEQARQALAPRLVPGASAGAALLAQGEPAAGGIGIGRVVLDADEAERAAARGENVVLARRTTSPDDVHGMLVARAVVTEQGGATSHAAVVGRALGLPVVVGCGAGMLERLADRVVTVDGHSGHVYEGELEVSKPAEWQDPRLRKLIDWAAAAAPLAVYGEAEAPAALTLDLDSVTGGEDPARLGELVRGFRGARGHVLASDAGIAAAVEAGLEFVVVSAVLPALLAACAAVPGRKQTAP
jgi:pyruvate,orthophosphate dikinase